MWAYPCAKPDPVIWFVTFTPAVIPAIVDFISYGCRDITKFKAGIGSPCGRLFKAAGAKTFGPAFQDPSKNLLKFTLPIEKALFWWFVADLAADTLARWTSLAFQLNGCNLPNEAATFQHTEIFQGAFNPNSPKPIIGNVTNYQGVPGLATSGGCRVPPGWYWQGSFTAKVHAIFTTVGTSIQTWINTGTGSGYDLPSNGHPPGYPGQAMSVGYTASGQNPDLLNHRTVSMWGMTDQLAILDSLEANWTVSKTPPLDWSLSPLSCFRDLTVQRTPDPAGRNRRGRQPTIIDPFLPAPAPVPRRGPPKGKPRPINS